MSNLPIGIFGGTFDPIHRGHIHLATAVQQNCELQKVILIPCHCSPLRQAPTTNAAHRLNMIKLAIQDQKHLELDPREINKPTVSYTYETLAALRQENKNTPLALIMGIDAFNRFDEWYMWQEILKLSHIIIADRPSFVITNENSRQLLAQHLAKTAKQLQAKTAGLIFFAEISPLPIASTEIRALIAAKKDAGHLVSPNVWRYICENNLYSVHNEEI